MKRLQGPVGTPTPGATFFGTPGDDVIHIVANPRSGFRYTDALGGNDRMNGSIYNDGMIGNDGDDLLYGRSGNDVLSGGAGANLLNGGSGSDYASYQWDIRGVTVDLAIKTAQDTHGAGTDTIIHIENLIGTRFADLLYGSDDSNYILAGGGNNTVTARGGDDFITSGRGNDKIFAGDGNDTVTDSGGNNVLDGGAGIDTLALAAYGPSVHIDLALNTAQITSQNPYAPELNTILNFENIVANGSDSVMFGNEAANQLSNSNFNTIFTGLNTPDIGANDVIDGRGGNDTLSGGAGDDVLTGGTGADSFAFAYRTANQSDVITDFSAAEGDKIDLRGIVYGIPLRATFSPEAVFSGLAGEFHVTGPAADQIAFFDLNGDSIADELIYIASSDVLTSGDFIL